MSRIEVLFFDVLGTVVDYRGSLTAEIAAFLTRHNASHIDASTFADAWIAQGDDLVAAIRSGQRDFAPLDKLNRESLETCLTRFGLSDLPPQDVTDLNHAWDRLRPWPDSVAGIRRLRENHIVVPLSDATTRMLIDMSRAADLVWDTVLGGDTGRAYKPTPQVYHRACELLGVAPANAVLVAAHPYDLDAAKGCGLRTAFVPRDGEGAASAASSWDYTAPDLIELAAVLHRA